MRHKIALTILVIISLTLWGCGFHLRHSQAQLWMKYPQIYLPPTGSNTLHQGLHRALMASSIHVTEEAPPKNMTVPTLKVLSQNISNLPLVYGPDSELRRERLKMSVFFYFQDNLNRSERVELYTVRDRQINPNQHLGDNAEKIVIENEMQADIISQLVRFLASRPS